jgi:hypothetical protein
MGILTEWPDTPGIRLDRTGLAAPHREPLPQPLPFLDASDRSVLLARSFRNWAEFFFWNGGTRR